MLLSRVSSSKGYTSTFANRSGSNFQIKQNFSTLPTSTKVVRYRTTGAPQEVLKVETESLPTQLEDNQIMVKMLAAPINPADINMIEGTYGIKPTLPAIGGNEGVAKVVAIGSKVQAVKENDHVIPIRPGLGTWRTFGVFSEKDFMRVPTDIKPEYAATISVNPCTALRLLDDFVELKPGDVIVQNGANSSVGLSVAQLAHERKVKTINIIRNRPGFASTVERIKALGGYMVVSEDYAVTPQFKRLISDIPKPKLALNCVGGPSATEMARILDIGGTMVTYGGMSRKPVTVPTSQFIFKDITLKGFWLSKWLEQHSLEDRAKMLETLFPLIRRDKFKLWMETWKFDQFSEGLAKSFEEHKDRKIVLVME